MKIQLKGLAKNFFIHSAISVFWCLLILFLSYFFNWQSHFIRGLTQQAGSQTPANVNPPPSNSAKGVGLEEICISETAQFCFAETTKLRIEACLQDNYEKISGTCKDRLKGTRDRLRACEVEIKKYCPQTNYGGGRIRACLVSAGLDNLSDNCKKTIGL